MAAIDVFVHACVERTWGQKRCDCIDLDDNLLSVDPKLTGERFYEAKEAVYRRACAAWDARDNSSRARISQSQISGGHPGSDGSQGSQPQSFSPPVEGA